MIISRLILKNWRNFSNVDVSLGDRVFILGPNASGKSNLLDAIRFLRDIAKQPGGGLQSAVKDRGGLSKIRNLSARRDPVVELGIELLDGQGTSATTWTYRIGITQQIRGDRLPILKFEQVYKNNIKMFNRPNTQEEKEDELLLSQTHLEQISVNKKIREIADFLKSIRYVHLVPQLLRHPESFQGTATSDDPFGRNFLESIAKTPEKTRKSRLNKIGEALKEAVPKFKDLQYIKDDAGIPHLQVQYEHWRPQAGLQKEDQFSDGTLRMIGLFWSLLDGENPLLLEEPELSLHSEIVKKLPSLFASVQRKKRRQIFVSTHSAELLSDRGIGAEEILHLTPSDKGTEVSRASEIQSIRSEMEAGLSAADAVLPRTAPSDLKQLSLF